MYNGDIIINTGKSMKESMDTIHEKWKLIFHALKKASGPVLTELSLSKVDANILMALRGYKMVAKYELSERLSFKPNSLTRSIDRLVARNVLKRSENTSNRRKIDLSLTEEGEQLAKDYMDLMQTFWKTALRDFNQSELKALDASMSAIINNLNMEE